MNKALLVTTIAFFFPVIASANVLRYHWDNSETLSLNTETHMAHLNATCALSATPGDISVANLTGPYQIHGNRLEISRKTIGGSMVHIFFRKTASGGWTEIPPYPSHKLLSEFAGSGCGFMLNPYSVAYLHKRGEKQVTFVPNN